jgi:HD-GYP domain-containing protein (c-di-GMP phosphodiesterase class II)
MRMHTHAPADEAPVADNFDLRAHQHAVARIAGDAARALGYSRQACEKVILAASLHDIGKRRIEAELSTDGPLDAAEWAHIRLHPVLGEQILIGEGLTEIAPWVRSHHEQPDGLGYPDGLRGPEIPRESLIIAVADAYDAMTSARPYRAAISAHDAAEQLVGGAGTQFDPEVVAVVLRAVGDRLGGR